jgi:hypothetical protein
MTTNAANVQVGFTGEVFFAPAGTTLPTTATAALDGAFVGMGFNTEEGVTETPSESYTSIKAWQRGEIVRKIRTEEDWTWGFGMLETNPTALLIYYGNYSAGGVKIGGQNTTRGSWVIDVLDGDNKIRTVIPDGEITGRGAHSYKTDEGIMFPVTLTAYPDATLQAKAIVYRAVLP